MVRLGLILASIGALSCAACAADRGDAEVVALDAVALRAELAAGRLSAVRVTQAYLRRIEALDDAGPSLAAVIEVNPEAAAIARGLDEQFLAGGVVGPLHGVPVLVKANIDTADGMATSAGSLALAEHRPSADADVVARLRAAGAVVLGKTNLSEWANFRSTASTSGWSSLGGQTRNPFVLDRNPCGSSSGAAVAVAARLAPLAVGTETDGSIVCPGAANGVVGIKPTIGIVSQRGIVPIARSQDTAGPLARNVADAALLLAVLVDPGMPVTAPGSPPVVAGLRIGVVRNFHGAGREPPVEAAFALALGWLQSAGAVLVDPVNAALPAEVETAELKILLAEFRDQIGDYLAQVRRGPQTLDELIEYNAAHAAQVMPHFGQELLLTARDDEGTDGAGYAAALEVVTAAREALAKVFADHDLDVLVAPANSRAWRIDFAAGDEGRVSSSSIAAVSGYPSIVVPVDVVGELPLGVALIGKPRAEALLLAFGEAIERRRGPFPEPRFLPSTAD
jgi:amidase